MVHFGEFLKTWSFRSNSDTRQVRFIRTKISGKCQNCKNSNATIWAIFKQCEIGQKVWKVSESETNLLDLSFFPRNVQLSRRHRKRPFLLCLPLLHFVKLSQRWKVKATAFFARKWIALAQPIMCCVVEL